MINLANELRDNNYYLEVLNEYVEKEKSTSKEFRPDLIQQRLLESYKFDIPRLVKIPKSNRIDLRDIYIFNEDDSFALKVINKILTKNLSHLISDNVFSYKKGVRCFTAAKSVQSGLSKRDLVSAKLDISNFFLSVDKNIIIKSIEELIEDEHGKKLLTELFNIESYSYKNETYNEYLGIMPGSALSSFFANYILKDVDNEIEKDCEVYARYSDDILIMCNTSEELVNVIIKLKRLLKDYGLEIKSSKTKFYESNELIEFLGLEITEDYIDISKETFKDTKKLIKEICKDERKKFDISNRRNRESLLRHTINRINKVMYKGILRDINEHKGGRSRYIFSSVTTDKTLKELDFYTKDRLRFVYSGKNNNSSNNTITNDYLQDLGWVSMVQMYNLYKVDFDVYKSEVDLLNYKHQRDRIYEPIGVLNRESVYEKIVANSFSDLYYELLDNNGKFILEGMIVNPEDLEFNLNTREIYLELGQSKRIYLYKDGLLEKNINIILIDRLLECKIRNNCLSSLDDRDNNVLLELYTKACYKEDYSFKQKTKLTDKIKFFRNFKLNYLYSHYTLEFLEIETPYRVRYNRFLSYVFFHINSNVLWDELDYSKQFIKVKNDIVYLILKKEWF